MKNPKTNSPCTLVAKPARDEGEGGDKESGPNKPVLFGGGTLKLISGVVCRFPLLYDVAPTGKEEAAEHVEACIARHGSGAEAR